MSLAQIYSAVAGDTITAARWNNEFGNLYTHGTDVAFPVTKAVSFAGFTVTFDAAGFTTVTSTASTGFLFTVGAKAGGPSANGTLLTLTSSTFTDTSTAAAGTATLYTGLSIRTPTLAAANAGVITTDAASVYIEAAPIAGANETITNPWALWVDSGAVRFDGNFQVAGNTNVTGTLTVGSVAVGVALPVLNELRLTLTSGLPVTTADVTAAGTLYLTPYKGKHISLYSGSVWTTYATAEISLALVLTSGKPYDVFCYDNAGVPTLEVLVWTNDTTRATALAYQDGVLVKSGATTRRYIGSIYASGANTTEDSYLKRYVWNYYNRVSRVMRRLESTDTWNYTVATFRQARAQAANQLDFILGVSEDAVTAQVTAQASNNAANASIVAAIGLDSTTTPATNSIRGAGFTSATLGNITSLYPLFIEIVAAGRHVLVWLEYSEAAGTTTWYGDNGATNVQAGIQGIVFG